VAPGGGRHRHVPERRSDPVRGALDSASVPVPLRAILNGVMQWYRVTPRVQPVGSTHVLVEMNIIDAH